MSTIRPIRDVDIDVRSLRYFVAVAEELSFTRAATRLFVAQQAISRDIRRLEDQLGTRLFARNTRRVTLTPDGERLLAGRGTSSPSTTGSSTSSARRPARSSSTS